MFLKITVIQNLIALCLFQYFVLLIRKYNTNEENSKFSLLSESISKLGRHHAAL